MTNRELSELCMHYILHTDTTSGPALEAMYLDYQADFMTTADMAGHAELSLDLLEAALSYGKEFHTRPEGVNNV